MVRIQVGQPIVLAPADPGMSLPELSESFLAQVAGWEAMKRARSLAGAGRVEESRWDPPTLEGRVRDGPAAYRAGLVIRSSVDIDNLCPCRDSKRWGKICAHSVAVGLHFLGRASAGGAPADAATPGAATRSIPSPPPRSPAPPSGHPNGLPAAAPPGRRLARAPDPAAGVPLQIHVVLPPNLEPALARGRITLGIEGESSASRKLLDAWVGSAPCSLAGPDIILLDALEKLAGGTTPGLLQLGLEQFAALLPSLIDHPRITIARRTPVRVLAEPARPGLAAHLRPDGAIDLSLPAAARSFIPGDRPWLFSEAAFQPFDAPLPAARPPDSGWQIPRSEVPRWLEHEWPRWLAGGRVAANFTLNDFELIDAPPRFELSVRGGLTELDAALFVLYGTHRRAVGGMPKTEDAWLPDPDSPLRYFARDPGSESAALGRLLRAGFSPPDAHGRLGLAGQDSVFDFLAREYPRLEREWVVSMEERLEQSVHQQCKRVEPQIEFAGSGTNWLDLRIEFKGGSGGRLAASEVQSLLLSGRGHRRRAGSDKVLLLDTAALEEWHEFLHDAAPQQQSGVYRLDRRQAGYLDATLQHLFPGQSIPCPLAQSPAPASLVWPEPLQSALRPYQRQGIEWLLRLWRNGFSGLLADEMGLGKTVQALGLIELIHRARPPEDRRPFLVVCPSSLVENWQREAARFTPNLDVLAIEGARRAERLDRAPAADLLVTSYALLRLDQPLYSGREFAAVILDEAQQIKNRQTQIARAVKSLRAPYRLVLTGTPLENSVADLWSIFDFLMPGYLGSAREFKERYESPILQQRDEKAQARLSRRLRPFVLRRTKRAVAPELPPRIEQVLTCALTPGQAGIYRQLLEAARGEIFGAVRARGLARSRVIMLNALLRLRQACCDPRLLNPETPEPEAESAKLDLFAQRLEESIDGGHRVLVFSQFVQMLALIRQRLDADRIPFCYLDGQTRHRLDEVDRFQSDPAIPVFLISLKAGGLGLNLTGADTVIHYDPWWNPAVEDQAADRAHRIGQQRVVNIYKLIVRDTIEEKVLDLQRRKRHVSQAMLGAETGFDAALDWDDIQQLLA